jgi:hypothetical protein
MKSLTVMLTAALVFCLSASALAQTTFQDVRSPDTVTPVAGAPPATFQDMRAPDNVTAAPVAAATFQDMRAPDNVTPAAPVAAATFQDMRSPDSVTPLEPGSAPAAGSSPVTVPADGGLSALLIVLISLAGALTLAAVAYATMRLAHAHHGPPLA